MTLHFRSAFALLIALVATPLFAAVGDVSPAQPKIPDRTFNLADYGAVGDGTTLNTEAFKKAIAAVDQSGGGKLIVPAGNWFTGPLDLCSAIDFHLAAGATLYFSPKMEDYGTG